MHLKVGGVRRTCVSFVGVSASATVGGVRFVVVAFVTETLATQASNGFFFSLLGTILLFKIDAPSFRILFAVARSRIDILSVATF